MLGRKPGSWPGVSSALALRPLGPTGAPSNVQNGPSGVSTTRGARSRHLAATRSTNSAGGMTLRSMWSSAEMIRSVVVGIDASSGTRC